MGCKELRYKVIHRFRDRFTVEELCKLLEVSRSGYYKWLNRKDEPDKDKVIADLIVECHKKAHRTYGYRRVKIWLLRETGLDVYEEETALFFEDYSDEIIHDDKLSTLIAMPNVLVTSHQAFLTREALDAIAKTTMDNLSAYFDGEELANKIVANP